MKQIPDGSVDMILCDLPYGTTACKWDIVIPFELLWKQYNRVLKKEGVTVLFGREPFTSIMITSNISKYRYSWIWEKDTPSDFLNSAYKPLGKTEDICVFSEGTVGSLSKNPIRYFPQGVIEVNKIKKNNPNSTWRENKGYSKSTNSLNSNKKYVQKFTNLPSNILKFSRDKPSLHPTQKPVALLEYLIMTYSKEGERILDNTMGVGSTILATKNTNRKGIGIEKEKKYYNIAVERLR